MSLDNLKKALENKKLIIGTSSTIKALKLGKPSEVYITANCPEDVKDRIKSYAKELNISCVELKETNVELGSICKKSFAINSCYY